MTPLLGWLRRDRGHSDERDPRLRGDDGRGVVASDSVSTGLAPSPSAGPAPSRSVSAVPSLSVIPAKAGIPNPPHQEPALVFRAAALVLTSPGAALLSRLDTIEAALDGPAAERFAPILAHLRGRTLSQLQSFHIQEFDLSRRHALHLSYWTDGDTRRRGEVLAEIKGVYRESGLLVDTGGELPDYLPMVLEFAVADPERGVALLQRFRASVELLRLGLTKDGLPHAGVLEAVCDRLPGESPKTHAEVQARYGEARPVEFVGLDSVESLLQRPQASSGEPHTLGSQPHATSSQPHASSGQPDAPNRHPASSVRHPREGGDLAGNPAPPVIPAKAGMTLRRPGGS